MCTHKCTCIYITSTYPYVYVYMHVIYVLISVILTNHKIYKLQCNFIKNKRGKHK